MWTAVVLITAQCVRYNNQFSFFHDVKKNVQPWVDKQTGMTFFLLYWQTLGDTMTIMWWRSRKMQSRRLQGSSWQQWQRAVCREVRTEMAVAFRVAAELLVPLTRPAPVAPARTRGQRRCWQGWLTRLAPAAPSTRHWTQICGTYERRQPTPGEWTWVSGGFNQGLKELWLLLAALSLFFFLFIFFNMALCTDVGFVPNHEAHTQHMFKCVFLYLLIHHLWLRQTTV